MTLSMFPDLEKLAEKTHNDWLSRVPRGSNIHADFLRPYRNLSEEIKQEAREHVQEVLDSIVALSKERHESQQLFYISIVDIDQRAFVGATAIRLPVSPNSNYDVSMVGDDDLRSRDLVGKFVTTPGELSRIIGPLVNGRGEDFEVEPSCGLCGDTKLILGPFGESQQECPNCKVSA